MLMGVLECYTVPNSYNTHEHCGIIDEEMMGYKGAALEPFGELKTTRFAGNLSCVPN